MRVPISVVVITFNEEKNIGRCIESVKHIADDIVVVDSFSTDNTEKICLELGVRFVKHKFDGYIEQKNYALTQAIHPYVLSLDADETLDEKLKGEIQKIKLNWQYDGYSFNRLTNYCGKWIRHCGWYPDIKLRLWDIRRGEWKGLNPHDIFVMKKDSTICHVKGNILHYSYRNISQHLTQIVKFANIAARAKKDKGKSVSAFMIIIRPFFIFIKKFFLKLGFLDGYYGFVICVLSAYGVFQKDILLRELNKSPYS